MAVIDGDDDDGNMSTRELMTFCMQLVHHSHWKSQRRFYCGSRMEISIYWLLVKHFAVSKKEIDIDVMNTNTLLYAANRSVVFPDTYMGDIIRTYADDVHTGYVRLIREKDDTEIQLSDLCKMGAGDAIHGPAISSNFNSVLSKTKYDLTDTATDLANHNYKCGVGSYDDVYAIHSPYWPVEAAEWITRRRSHSSPSKSLVKRVVRYGCDFVQVSHNRSNNENEWRFSFSRAELFIAKSLSTSQRIVYATLWVLNKKIASSKLCSYYFKTLMLWACEEKPTEFWRDNSLVNSVYELLIEITKWVKSKVCVNYFIPGNNMIDHLIDTDLSCEINALWETIQSRRVISEIIDSCRRAEFVSAITTRYIELPSWIKRAFVINWRVNNTYETYANLFGTDITEDLQNALYVELSDVYRALRFQQKSVCGVDEFDKRVWFLKSESHLLLAVNQCESLEREVIKNSTAEFTHSILHQYISRGADIPGNGATRSDDGELKSKRRSIADEQKTLNDNRISQKCLLYSRGAEKHEHKRIGNNFWESRDVSIAFYIVAEERRFTGTPVETLLYKEWPGRSPTVNASWFVAKAYLANLYYTTRCDVNMTIKTCEDIIDVYRLSGINERFAEKTFPVVLSTQWACIYDKELQELLGFYSLCSFVFDRSSRSVYLGVCPVLLAFYLRLRIVIDHEIDDCIDDCISEYMKHIEICTGDKQVNNGIFTLSMSFINLYY